ncbi:Peroxiredoxin [Pseudarcicella hirudinis]|uniref:Peroxiredoxin n=1 Tax=Pseudarcicella hirudinis TaxID=1079859 RepID=A0A1I5UA88_9BACT|nr:TlpA disulfide reductase family protein [Pseudarcicella hirudinis]SFP92214.1 Peroxiredoxin [Pseudarcicella hirudinis]
MRKLNYLIIPFAIAIIYACSTKSASTKPKTGLWRAVLASKGGELPFGLDISLNADSSTYTVFALNGEERLQMDSSFVKDDSLHIPMGIFEAEIIAKITSDSTLSGYWKKRRKGTEYTRLDLQAFYGDKTRFKVASTAPSSEDVSGKWATTFLSDDLKDTTKAVGIFTQKGKDVTGTFLTTTGDYRFLQGNIDGDSLKLSCFDGSHLFLFKSKFTKDKMTGEFFSGATGHENWTAVKDEKAELEDVNRLTFLKPGFDKLSFSFPDLTGKKISLEDPKFKNKVVIVQILGSWCPNCMDETTFLSPWYKKNKDKGFEIIGLAYEKSADLKESSPKIAKMKKRFDIDYDVVLAGTNDKAEASKTLPMLNRIVGFPTTIIIDKKGKVREIHTGFSGPGTGKYYDKWVEDFERLTEKLVKE